MSESKAFDMPKLHGLARRLARRQAKVGFDLWNSTELKKHIAELLKPFRTSFSMAEFGIIHASVQRMVHEDANNLNMGHRNKDVPSTPIRDIDEAKVMAGWYVDNWVMTRLAELKALKIEVDGEGRTHIGVPVDPEADKPKEVFIGDKPIRVGQIGVTAEKPANPWDKP